jgi:hypothetical protein
MPAVNILRAAGMQAGDAAHNKKIVKSAAKRRRQSI